MKLWLDLTLSVMVQFFITLIFLLFITGNFNILNSVIRYLLKICLYRYNKPNYHNDIGLVRVKEKIIFLENKVESIDFEWREVPANEYVRLFGWGRISAGGKVPDKLQVIDLKHISYEECKERHSNDTAVDYGHFCTFNKAGEAACNGGE